MSDKKKNPLKNIEWENCYEKELKTSLKYCKGT